MRATPHCAELLLIRTTSNKHFSLGLISSSFRFTFVNAWKSNQFKSNCNWKLKQLHLFCQPSSENLAVHSVLLVGCSHCPLFFPMQTYWPAQMGKRSLVLVDCFHAWSCIQHKLPPLVHRISCVLPACRTKLLKIQQWWWHCQVLAVKRKHQLIYFCIFLVRNSNPESQTLIILNYVFLSSNLDFEFLPGVMTSEMSVEQRPTEPSSTVLTSRFCTFFCLK